MTFSGSSQDYWLFGGTVMNAEGEDDGGVYSDGPFSPTATVVQALSSWGGQSDAVYGPFSGGLSWAGQED